jgi:serine transporter
MPDHTILATSHITREDVINDRKQDTLWTLGLYGTAIGAGTLFLPIDAGLNGIIPLIVMALLAFPMTHYSHRALCRFIQSGASEKNEFTDVVSEHFGKTSGNILTFLYFFSIYPILLMYSVAITNTTSSFITNQMGLTAPPRALLAFLLIMGLMAIVRLGQPLILKTISMLVYPFITILILLSIYLIPHWNTAFLTENTTLHPLEGSHTLLTALWLLIPVLVFSFSHTPIISSFATHQKQRFGALADKKSTFILRNSHLMMVSTVMFFVFSCVFSLSPQDLALAKQQNISILSYLANHFDTPIIRYVTPVIAFIAISKSFLGHYIGASEGLHGLVVQSHKSIKNHTIKQCIELFMIITCWVVATLNPSILGMIESLGGPAIAIILFLMPMYAMRCVPALKHYRHPFAHVFTVIIGVIAISAILYGLCKAFVE